ncbi:hypothetical protein NT6N_24700 [Oceaniferula spumae]|uniref:Uncharacterized protein n=1 Tax=Oceaniferula spumae TaxID=2979115 RepID=A0AAT9FNA1_9BACT
MTNPIIHEGSSGSPSKIYEYNLPFSVADIGDRHQHIVSAWFQQFDAQDSQGVSEILAQEWMGLQGKSATKVAGNLLKKTPKSILFDADDMWLRLDSQNLDQQSIAVRAPVEVTVSEMNVIQEFDSLDLPELKAHFSNLSEGVTLGGNSLWLSTNPVTEKGLQGCGVWAGSIPIYYVCCGDLMLLSRCGRVGRWMHEYSYDPSEAEISDGSCVEPVADSLSLFFEMYLDYLELPLEGQKDTPFW